MKTNVLISFIIAIAFITSCTNCPEIEKTVSVVNEISTANEPLMEIAGLPVADSIVYDVITINPDPTDEWKDECIRGMNNEILISKIFDGIYSGKLTAVDIFDNHAMTIEEVKEIEMKETFSRVLVGKLQFIENWNFDTVNYVLNKKVNGILFGYEKYKENGELQGYNGLFRVDF